MNIKNIVRAELYKFAHSSLIWIHIFVPFFAMSGILAYYRFSSWSESEKVIGFLQILSVSYPVMIALIMTVVSDFETQAGACQMLLTVPCQRSVAHIVKLSVLLACGLLSCILAVAGFGVGFRMMGNVSFSMVFFIRSAMLLFCGNVTLYELCYLVSFCFQRGAGIVLGIAGTLVSALMQTGLGDAVWYYVPCGISIRWCSLYVMSQTKDLNLMIDADVKKSVIFVVALGAVLFALLLVWGNIWETQAAQEE